MASKNDITGDTLQTKVPTNNYRDNYDKIFGKTEAVLDRPGMWKHSCHDGQIWVVEGQACTSCNTTMEDSK